MHALTVKNLSKQYRIGTKRGHYTTLREELSRLPSRIKRNTPSERAFWALDNVSFNVATGESVGVIGRNGAGKSTLLKILSRITEPTKGNARIRGRLASLLEVGTGFHPELSGRENIYFNGSLLGMSRAEINAKFNDIVDFSGVAKMLDTPVKHYSSGMHVRLAFSVAAHVDPEILIIDEVLSVGDSEFQKRSLGKMKHIARDGRTVLFVSHNMSLIQSFCSRALWLEGGALKADDTPSKVIAAYSKQTSRNNNAPPIFEMSRTGELGTVARLFECTVLGDDGNPTDQLLYGEPFSIRFGMQANQACGDMDAVARIDASDGQTVTSPTSNESQIHLRLEKKERGTLTASFADLTLAPGQYWVSPSIRDGHTGLDEVTYAVQFEVLEAAYKDTPPHPKTWGHVQTYPSWRVGI